MTQVHEDVLNARNSHSAKSRSSIASADRKTRPWLGWFSRRLATLNDLYGNRNAGGVASIASDDSRSVSSTRMPDIDTRSCDATRAMCTFICAVMRKVKPAKASPGEVYGRQW